MTEQQLAGIAARLDSADNPMSYLYRLFGTALRSAGYSNNTPDNDAVAGAAVLGMLGVPIQARGDRYGGEQETTE